jgi:CRISPR/Cas system-associated exonuclease Cas4 (RecB family)
MAHSYSAIKLYEQCPSKYKFNRIDRLFEPSGPAAERGTSIHSELENILNGSLMLLSDPIMHLSDKLEDWIKLKALPELKFAVDHAWQQVDYTAPAAMFRGIIDLYIEQGDEATVLDFKTGKDRDYSDQVTVYAAVILATKPHIKKVNLVIEFIDLKKTTTYSPITRDQLSDLKTLISGRIALIVQDSIFAPNPSGLCRFCHFRKSNGGPCKW